MDKKEKPISRPVLLIGLFFLSAFIAAMIGVCHLSPFWNQYYWPLGF